MPPIFERRAVTQEAAGDMNTNTEDSDKAYLEKLRRPTCHIQLSDYNRKNLFGGQKEEIDTMKNFMFILLAHEGCATIPEKGDEIPSHKDQ
jgi:hypothetical protein